MLLRNILIFLLLNLSIGLIAQPDASVTGQDQDLKRCYEQAWYSQCFGYNVPANGNYLLYDTVVTWLGTPYRYAGNSNQGIDCSGFVNVLYDRVFGIHIGARNSSEIYQLVEKIDKDDLREGDFVFFRIRSKSRISHVGVYLGEHRFAHASTSRGVIISDLNDPYYKKYFAGAGRHQVIVDRLAAERRD